MLQKLRSLRQLADVSSDQQDRGLDASLVVDRATAARFGISAQTIDNTLYDAFGQRQVSTMYTPLNQYHVVMEVEQGFLNNPDGLTHLRAPDHGPTDSVERIHALRYFHTFTGEPFRTVSLRHHFF